MAPDLAVIIPSADSGGWLRTCLPTVFASAAGIDLEVIVPDNGSSDDTAAVVSEFAGARLLPCENHGFAHANNRALATTQARYVLFLNPDTEIVEGTLGTLVRRLDELPHVGLAGVRQVDAAGAVHPTMRRFPGVRRQLFEALAGERWPLIRSGYGERELDVRRYEEEFDLDWTVGSFMLTRREALQSAGWMDERFFLYSEEVDLAYRIRRAGWTVRHLPQMTIVHHTGRTAVSEVAAAQYAFSRRLYARKNLGRVRGTAFLAAAGLRAAARLVHSALGHRTGGSAPAAQWRALRVLAGRDGPPYEDPPPTAIRPFTPERGAAGR